MVIAILMESEMNLSDDLLEEIIDKVSCLKFKFIAFTVVFSFCKAFNGLQDFHISADI